MLFLNDVIYNVVSEHVPHQSLEENWDVEGLELILRTEFALDLPIAKWLKEESNFNEELLHERIQKIAFDKLQD